MPLSLCSDHPHPSSRGEHISLDMATINQNGAATGISKDEADLRRRNVHSYENANGGQVVKIEAEDKKKVKKVRLSRSMWKRSY